MNLAKQLAIIAGLAALAGGVYLAVDRFGQGPTQGTSKASSAQGAKAPQGKGGGPRSRLVEVGEATMRKMEISIDAVGTSRARQSIEVVALADGRVGSITFKAGQKVSKGDILVQLDTDIEAADVAQAEAVLKETDLAMVRARTLQERNAGKQSTVDEIAAKQATARAALDRAQRRLRDRTVRAPFDGVVGIRRIDVGARVDNKTVLTTLDDLSSIDIDFLVPEDRFGQITQGQRVMATTAAFPGRSFDGTITAIDSRIDQVGRAFKVRATIPNPDSSLPAGLFMLVRVVLDSRERLTVPEAAIVPEAGRALVYVVENGKVKETEVVIGQRERGVAEIRSGLTAGRQVVVKGFAALRDGAEVRIARPGAPGAAKSKRPGPDGGAGGDVRPGAAKSGGREAGSAAKGATGQGATGQGVTKPDASKPGDAAPDRRSDGGPSHHLQHSRLARSDGR